MPTRQGNFISNADTTITTPSNFGGGNQTGDDIKSFCESMVSAGSADGIWNINEIYGHIVDDTWVDKSLSSVSASSGGTLSINSLNLGSYDYVIKHGDQTVSTFTNSDWFTTTEDSRSAFIFVNGNLTINSGVTFKPSNRKLFTCIYVKGDLTINGEISMSARGANHSSGAGNVAKQNLKLVPTGTYSSVSNPQIPATGGTGGNATPANNGSYTGTAGSAGTSGGTGGGGTGGWRENNNGAAVSVGNGADGTSFSGGGGSGGVWSTGGGSTSNAGADGGAGSNAGLAEQGSTSFGGAGNGGGSANGTYASEQIDNDGTGGVLIIFCTGTLSGTGSCTCDGVQGGYTDQRSYNDGTRGTSGGGGSGGGSLNIFYGTDSFTGTISADGGAGGIRTGGCSGGACAGGSGGAGGAGTARKLSITAS